MQTLYGVGVIGRKLPPSTVCIGVFDGVHRGHQALIRRAVDDGIANNRPSVVLTFDRHPLSILRPEKCPPLVLPLDHILRRIEDLGINVTVVAHFNRTFSEQTPDLFFEEVLQSRLSAEKVVVGHDFAFGKDRAGNADWLAARIATDIVGPIETDGHRISSTEIRASIADGKIEHANNLLGEQFTFCGLVVPGQKLAREWGMPTVNLIPVHNQVVPGNGIYGGVACTRYGNFVAAIGVGTRPTIERAGFAVEAHLLDFPSQEMYGQSVDLQFHARLRDEQKFDSTEKLVEQMQNDCADARAKVEFSR